jgi:hypothetical protein
MALADTSELEALIGRDALAALVSTSGGLALRIPRKPPMSGPLCDLPLPAQKALTWRYGGTVLYVPKCEGEARAARDAAIRAAYDAGERVQDIARRYRLSERWVYDILCRKSDSA